MGSMLPCIAAPWIRHGFLSWWRHFAFWKRFSDHLIRLQGNVCSSQLGPHNLRHPVPTSSLGQKKAAAALDSYIEGGTSNHIRRFREMWDPQHHRFQYFTDLMLDNLGYPHDLRYLHMFFCWKRNIGIATLDLTIESVNTREVCYDTYNVNHICLMLQTKTIELQK